MKICIIENIYPPYDRGGAEQVVMRIVQGLLDAGHEVVIVTSCPGKSTIEKSDRLTIYRRKQPNIYFYTDAHKHNPIARLVWHVLGIWNIPIARWVSDILRKERPDVAHTHNLMGLSFLIPGVIRRLGLRHVHTVHDVQLVEPSAMILKKKENNFRYTGFPSRLYTALMKKLFGSPDVVISPSQFLLDFYTARGFFKHSSRVLLRNPMTFDLPAPARVRRIKEDGILRCLYVGQVEYHKGIDILIEAWKIAAKARPDIALTVAGNGSKLEELRERVKDIPSVKVLGRVDREQLKTLFRQTDLAIAPSLCYENSPTVIFESLYFRVPVLASRIEGVAELIQEGINGMTCAVGDSYDFAQKIISSSEHPEILDVMSTKTTQGLPGLSLSEYIDELIALYSA